jgi:hypothetical protein
MPDAGVPFHRTSEHLQVDGLPQFSQEVVRELDRMVAGSGLGAAELLNLLLENLPGNSRKC